VEQTIGNSSAESPVVDAFYAKLNRKHLPSLDGLRGIAALLVVFYHFGIEFGFHPPPGYLGVLIFFVLSGFLITWLLLKESSATGTVSLSGFYLRRSLRIFPAFYGFWLFSIGVRILGHRTIAWGAAIASFFYVSNYYYSLVPGADTFMLHTWSLANEEQFYLLWPWVFKRAHNNLSRITVFCNHCNRLDLGLPSNSKVSFPRAAQLPPIRFRLPRGCTLCRLSALHLVEAESL